MRSNVVPLERLLGEATPESVGDRLLRRVETMVREMGYRRALNSAFLWIAVVELTLEDEALRQVFEGALNIETVGVVQDKYLADLLKDGGSEAPSGTVYVTRNFARIWDRMRERLGGETTALWPFWEVFLTPPDSERNESYRGLMEACGIQPAAHLPALQNYIDALAWGASSPTAPAFAARRAVASFQADSLDGQDHLGRLGDAQAMAGLIASRALVPPLAIGVFGPWGSGKSFFIRMIQQELQRLARAEADEATKQTFWPNIVPITFNAWHYVDANLWASLMSHILNELAAYGKTGDGSDARTQRYREALRSLELAGEAERRADATVNDKASALRQAEAAVRQAEQELEAQNDELVLAVAADVWTTVEAEMPWADTENQSARNALTAIRQVGALPGEVESVTRGLRDQLGGLLSTAGQVRLVTLSALRGQGFGRLSVVGLLVGALLAGAALTWFWRSGPVLQMVQHLVQLGGVAWALRNWIGERVVEVQGWLAPLESLRARIDTRLAAAEQAKATAIAKLQAQVELKREELAAARERRSEAAEAKAEAEAEVRRVASGQHIGEFIAQRLESGDYQKHLGVISLVRRDFETLSTMIGVHNALRSEKRQDEALRQLIAQFKARGVELDTLQDLGINRIVLFIDDLDRCPAEQVVGVLQAIHLLLAFPVFAVVVAVDSRWMRRSLQHEYRRMLSGEGGGRRPDEDGEVNPSDYLEKIFQIPYWLDALRSASSAELLHSLTRPDVAPAEPVPATEQVASVDPSLPVGQAVKGEDMPAEMPERAEPSEGKAGGVENPAEPSRSVTATERDEELVSIALPLDALRLSAEECRAIEQLGAVVGRSPRAAKRFLNTYRLIKASTPQVAEGEAYLAVLFLLALDGGAPLLMPRFYPRVSGGSDGTVVEALKFAVNEAKASISIETGDRLRAWIESDDAEPWRTVTIVDLRAVLARTRQFSFDRMSA